MGGRGQGVRLRYRRFVEEGLLREIESPLEAVQGQSVLGKEDFLQGIRDRLESRKEEGREVPALRQLRPHAPWESIVKCVGQAYRVPAEELLRRGARATRGEEWQWFWFGTLVE